MLTNFNSYKVEKSNEFNTKDFTIENSSIIFNVLSTKLYKNPLKILIQEYMCNARDAHRESSKNDIPIKVILPTIIKPQIHFIDTGIGISPKRIDDIFIKLGNSTKTNNNVETGGYGIGAKTAWSYTDSFYINTIHKNTEYKYLAYIDNGIGKLDLLSTNTVNKSNGTTIIVNIKPTDFIRSEKYVYRTSFFWDIKPEIINNTKYNFYDYKRKNIDNHATLITLDNKYSTTKYLESDRGKILIVIDGIIYDDIENYIYQDILSLDGNSILYLFFNTGDLFPVINREAIFNDENTKNKLTDKISLISQVIKDDLDISNVKDFYNLKDVLEKKEKSLFKLFKTLEISNNYYTLKYYYLNFYLDLADYDYQITDYLINNISNKLCNINVNFSIPITDSLFNEIIIINDKFTKTLNNEVIKNYCKLNSINSIKVISSRSFNEKRKTNDIVILFDILDKMDNVVRYSDIFNIVKKRKDSGNNIGCTVYSLNNSSVKLNYHNYEYLFSEYDYYIIYNGPKNDIYNYAYIIYLYNNLSKNKIIILKDKKDLSSKLNNKNIISFKDIYDIAYNFIKLNLDKINYYEYFHDNPKYNNLFYISDYIQLLNFEPHLNYIEDNEFKKTVLEFINYYKNYYTNDSDNIFYTELFDHLKRVINDKHKLNELDNKEENILKKIKMLNKNINKEFTKYPLLEDLTSRKTERTEVFLNYINVFYRSNKNNV